jgi:hypothetical protein
MAMLAGAMAWLPMNAAAADRLLPTATLTVCLELSSRITIGANEPAVFAELTAIWGPLGVSIRSSQSRDDCHRLIVVKAEDEARPEDASADGALGWVPFVAGQARQVVFLRLSRARTLIDALSPGTRPEGLTRLLVARLLGRTLSHELGHVLLNSRVHTATGLMCARYRAKDVLSEPTSRYTLDAAERAQLFTRAGGDAIARR